MALPEPFSDIEHLQMVIRRELNRDIREHFRDLHDDNGDWEPEINTTRGQMLRALLHEDSDPIAVTNARMMLYYFTYGKQQETPVTIEMTDRPQEEFTFRPEIKLYFTQSRRDVAEGVPPATGEISYRLMNETSRTLTPQNVKVRAERIKNLFASPSLFVWHKGKLGATYTDIPNGYKLRLLVTTELEAKRIIQEVLNIENKTPNWDNFRLHIPAKENTNIIRTEYIYGKQRKVPRWRPKENVKFKYAYIKIHGIPKPQYIVDCRYGPAIVNVAA